MTITPKNWRDFQHYKDRNPPWIRLHKRLLDDFDFYSLPIASKALAPMLWLLASESVSGVISLSIQKIAFRVRMSEHDLSAALKPLLDGGFFEMEQDDSAVLAEGLRHAVPMHCITETSTEAETSQVTPPLAPLTTTAPVVVLPAEKSKPAEGETALQTKCRETWSAYANAYLQRYRVEPVRNATVSSQIKQLVQRIGPDAPSVAAFYVGHNKAFYVSSTHTVGALVKDCEALRTQWATDTRVTSSKANEADRLQTQGDGWAQIIAEERAKEQANVS